MKNFFIPLFLFLSIFLAFTCTSEPQQNEKPNIEKAPFEDICSAMEGPWGISDGIKVTRGNIEEYFCFEIESPPAIIRNKADIRFYYRLDSLNKTNFSNQVTYSVDSLYPFYALNSLNVFEVNGKFGAYFQTALLGYPYGFDPYVQVMWVYYSHKLFKFTATIPNFPHNDWNESFSSIPDLKLKKECNEAYKLVVQIWEESIEKEKQNFKKQQMNDL